MDYFNKGNECYNKNDYMKAINLYKKSLAEDKNRAASLYNSAVCHIKLKEYDKAIPLINSALREKEDSRYYFNLAYCYLKSNNDKKALIYFNTAWALDNSDDECKKAIDKILKKIS